MDVVFVLGKVLLVLIAVMSGVTFHFSRAAIEAARASGGPAPEITAPLTGIGFIVGGLMVVLGIWADLGALIMIAMLLPISFIMHAFWKLEGEQQQMQMQHFMKNMAMIGGLLIVFWLYNQGQDVPASITDALFGRW